MSEPTSPDKSQSDLRTMVTGSADKVVLKDKNGVEHILQPLDLADLIEYEEKVGRGLLGAAANDVKFRDIAYLLYLSLRKEGMSPEDIAARRFKLVDRQIYCLFDLSVFSKTAEIFVDILRISGLDARPQTASQ